MAIMKKAALILFIVFSFCFSQTIAQRGWVALLSGDTLTGKVSIVSRGPHKMNELLVKSDNKVKKRFSPLQVRRAERDNEVFAPFKIDGKYQFARVNIEGYLSYCSYINPESRSFEDFSLSVLIRKDGEMISVSNIGFARKAYEFLKDCPAIRARKDRGELKMKFLEDMVNEYNDWIEVRTNKVKKGKNSLILQSMNAFIDRIKGRYRYASNDELREMLRDLRNKMANNETVPSYLSNGIKAHLGDDTELLEAFGEIVN